MMILASFLLLVSPTAKAWDAEGHRVISRIAGSLLSGKGRSFIYDHLVAGTEARSVTSALAAASIWPDLDGKTIYPDSTEFHFSFTQFQQCRPYDEREDCGVNRSGRCVVSGIAHYARRAVDLSLTSEERAESIKFISHMVADAHQPLHVGFREDRGGNEISIILANPSATEQKLPANLHKLWDSYLLDTYRLSAAEHSTRSWWTIGNKLIGEERNRKAMEIGVLNSVEAAGEFAAAIVSETATEVTCDISYKDEFGRYFDKHSNEIISEQYVERSIGAMKKQFVRAGVRLAQLLNTAACSYYAAIAAAAPVEGPVSNNIFTPLEDFTDFDPVESAYYVEDEEVVLAEPVQVVERIPSARLCGNVDIGALVLLRRHNNLYVTYRHLVTSDLFIPDTTLAVDVRISRDLPPISLRLDGSVFRGTRGRMSIELIGRILGHFCNRDDIQKSVEPFGGPAENLQVQFAKKKLDIIFTWIVNFARPGSFDGIRCDLHRPFSSVAFRARPYPTRDELIAMFGERVTQMSEDQVKLRIAMSSNFVVIRLGWIKLLTTPEYLADMDDKHWTLNMFPTTSDDQYLFVDIRVFDFVPPVELFRFLLKWNDIPANDRRSDEFIADKHPIILGLSTLAYHAVDNSSFDRTNTGTLIKAYFKVLNIVWRPERMFSAIDLKLRSPEERKLVYDRLEDV